MIEKSFKDLAKEAIDRTKEGLDYLVEAYELQEALKNLPKTESYKQFIEEIIEKEKIGVGLIQQAILIQRGLMNNQHKAIENLINNL